MKRTGVEIFEAVQLLRCVANANRYALKKVGSTVEIVNEDAVNIAAEMLMNRQRPLLLGVKNTGQISRSMLKRLTTDDSIGSEEADRAQVDYGVILHTFDKLAHAGRAVDAELRNPVTMRAMSGSSSGTALNVLLGINDVGVGTDGGGSVLAPALALNLFSVMAKGMDLQGDTARQSTDGISFVPGIGFIGKKFAQLMYVLYKVLPDYVKEEYKEHGAERIKLRIAVPKEGNLTLPDGRDMKQSLEKWLKKIHARGIAEIIELDLPNGSDRQVAIDAINHLWHVDAADVIMTYEGPVDVYGYGDSMFGCMGTVGAKSQNCGAKYLLKVANMTDATAVTIPDAEAACGVVLLAKKGAVNAWRMLKLAEELADTVDLPNLYGKYWGEYTMKRENSLIFAL